MTVARLVGVALAAAPFISAALLALHRAGRALHNHLTRKANQ